jgi:antitoxin StbD
MKILLKSLMASLTELRKLNKVIARAWNNSVAILNRNKTFGCLAPKSAVSDIGLKPISDEQVSAFLRNDLHEISHVLEYLKDK